MADRIFHECPECGGFIFFYDEYDESACDECGKWFKVSKVLVPVARKPLERREDY